MLELRNLTKKYGDLTALNGINYSFKNGIYGLLGTNGAGKTTMLKLICGLIRQSGGEILFNGEKINPASGNYLSKIGYMPQKLGFLNDYKVFDFLIYIASLKEFYGNEAKKEAKRLIRLLDLTEEQNKPMKALSGGNAQRVGIAQAMFGEPEILILDEPTVGLDPKERIKIRNIISSYSSFHTVILSTHIVSDISDIAGEIIIMDHGNIIAHGSERQLADGFDGSVWTLSVDREQAEEICGRYCISNTFVSETSIELRIVSKEKPHPDARPAEPTLEDLYLFYCGEDI
ncbi:MAG: ATP-binding cassette domain-containing protein [Firmicutes bacterium]|nr:ATP-binding cassette domain-containing protein [Bacillota bacterium]